MSTALYESVTAKIVASLEKGTVPWRKPWHTVGALPTNAVSKRPYRGINLVLLGMSAYRDHRWLTYRQAEQLGGHVRKGERAATAVLWKPWVREQEDPETGTRRERTVPLLRLYSVFNAEQCDGLALPALPSVAEPRAHGRLEAAEALVRQMPDPPTIEEGGTAAWYRPRDDLVQVPPLAAFTTPDAYYATLFHELGHATGHERRLNRSGVSGDVRFGSEPYSREELVAELASAFCCGLLGLDNSLVDNTASYLGGWLRALQGDPKALVVAAAQAQKAADYVQGLQTPELDGPTD